MMIKATKKLIVLFLITSMLLGVIGMHTYAAPNGNVINAADYGEKDSFALQKAIAACPAGGTVYIPEGNYLIKFPLILKSDITIEGEGEKTVLQADPGFSFDKAIMYNSASLQGNETHAEKNIRIKRITFVGSRDEKNRGVLLSLSKAKNIRIFECFFKDNVNIGVTISGSQDVVIQNSFFEGMGHEKPSKISAPALWTDESSQNVIVRGSTFQNNNWSGAYFMPSGGGIYGSRFIKNGESSIFTNEKGSHIEYVDNYIVGGGRSNISASGIEIGASDVFVQGNYIKGNDNTGISLTNLKNAVVKDNFIMNNGQDYKYFGNAAGVEILSLPLVENQSVPNNISITNNIIVDQQEKKTQKSALAFWKHEEGFKVENIIFKNNQLSYAEPTRFISAQFVTEGDGCDFTGNEMNQTISQKTENDFVAALEKRIEKIKNEAFVDLVYLDFEDESKLPPVETALAYGVKSQYSDTFSFSSENFHTKTKSLKINGEDSGAFTINFDKPVEKILTADKAFTFSFKVNSESLTYSNNAKYWAVEHHLNPSEKPTEIDNIQKIEAGKDWTWITLKIVLKSEDLAESFQLKISSVGEGESPKGNLFIDDIIFGLSEEVSALMESKDKEYHDIKASQTPKTTRSKSTETSASSKTGANNSLLPWIITGSGCIILAITVLIVIKVKKDKNQNK